MSGDEPTVMMRRVAETENDVESERGDLSYVQRTRVEALRHARDVIGSRGFASAGEVSAWAVMRVAQYIVDGTLVGEGALERERYELERMRRSQRQTNVFLTIGGGLIVLAVLLSLYI